MILAFIQRAGLVLLAVLAAWRIGLALGAGRGLLLWALGWAVLCGVGTWLLLTSTTGQVTWKNRVAGYLIPWGARLNRGKLWPIPAVSWLAWMAIGTAAVWLMPHQPAAADDGQGEGGDLSGRLARALLLVAWIVDGAALIYVLGTLSQAGSGSSSHRNTLLKTVAIILVIMGASVILHALGATRLALTVAGTPPLIVGGGFGMFLAAVLLFGRNVRWN